MAQQQDPNQNRQQDRQSPDRQNDRQNQPDRSFGATERADRGVGSQADVNTGRPQRQSGATEADEDLDSTDRRSSTTSRPSTDANTSGSKKAF